MNKSPLVLDDYEELKEDPIECGYKKVAANMDIHDRDRNPIGGLKEMSGFANRNNVEMDWPAQELKDEKKRQKISKGNKSNKC